MSVIGDFKKFALRGNVVDMAIGFTVGAAFTTIAKSLVDDIIMPPVGLATGGVDFSDLFIVLKHGTKPLPAHATLQDAAAAGAVTLNYGRFINNIIAFLLIAFAMFVIIRIITRIEDTLEREKVEKAPGDPEDKKCPYCLSTIPFHASRCAHCTSELPAEKAPAPGAAEQPVL